MGDPYPNSIEKLQSVIETLIATHGSDLTVERSPMGDLNVMRDRTWLGWINFGPEGPFYESTGGMRDEESNLP